MINVKVYFWICLCMFVELVVFIKDLKKKGKKRKMINIYMSEFKWF